MTSRRIIIYVKSYILFNFKQSRYRNFKWQMIQPETAKLGSKVLCQIRKSLTAMATEIASGICIIRNSCTLMQNTNYVEFFTLYVHAKCKLQQMSIEYNQLLQTIIAVEQWT